MLTLEIYGLPLSSKLEHLEKREKIFTAIKAIITNVLPSGKDVKIIEAAGVPKNLSGKAQLLIRVYTSDSKIPEELVEALHHLADVEVLCCHAVKKSI